MAIWRCVPVQVCWHPDGRNRSSPWSHVTVQRSCPIRETLSQRYIVTSLIGRGHYQGDPYIYGVFSHCMHFLEEEMQPDTANITQANVFENKIDIHICILPSSCGHMLHTLQRSFIHRIIIRNTLSTPKGSINFIVDVLHKNQICKATESISLSNPYC